MKIKLVKPTIVDGVQRQAGWSGDIGLSDARTLIGMGKSVSEEEETTAVNLQIDVANTEEFEALKSANASLIVAKEDAEIKLEEADNYILQLNSDIHNLTLKELRVKYPLEEQSNES
jgi:hypothetical protein